MDNFDLSEQRIVQLKQIPVDIRCQIERGDGAKYALDLSLNRLRSIDEIGAFEHVSQLDLSGNQLENVSGIQALRRLQSLDLSRNCLTSIDLLALLPTLQVLKVAENSLTTIDSLQLLSDLRVLDASYNRIDKWPTLTGLTLLETLDLSDNMLVAISSSRMDSLFPSRLRHLSIARNQIDKLCGIACLGLQLPMLKSFAFDGNPVVLEVARNGGQLERLLAIFFPHLPLSNDGDLASRDLAPSPRTSHFLKRVVLEDRENALYEFLATGSMAIQGVSSQPFPPPVSVLSTQRHATCIDSCDQQMTIGKSLSHDSKTEIWRQIQNERRAQLDSNDAFPLVPTKDKSVRWGQDIDQFAANRPHQDDIRTPALTAADLDVPVSSMQAAAAFDDTRVSATKPLDTTMFSGPNDSAHGQQVQNSDNVALVKKVKALTEQVATMRKYMKIWIKREKMVREASARKIQRWFRRSQRKTRFQLQILRSRMRRQEEYGFRHCSSSQLQPSHSRNFAQDDVISICAQIVQRHARGVIVRRRMLRFKKNHIAACKIQCWWKRARQVALQHDWKTSSYSKAASYQQPNLKLHRLVHGVIRCSQDVKQLQQVCAVQDDAISHLWSNQVFNESIDVEKKIAQFQRLWRDCAIQRQSRRNSKSTVNDKAVIGPSETNATSDVCLMKKQIDRQSLEIAMLKTQLQALQNLVASLAATKYNELK